MSMQPGIDYDERRVYWSPINGASVRHYLEELDRDRDELEADARAEEQAEGSEGEEGEGER